MLEIKQKHKSSLFQLLSTLNENEFKSFGKFITSPYFNNNSKLTELYKFIKNHYPDFNTFEVSKENLFIKLYKGKKYVDGTIKYLLSEMERQLEKFISIENTERFALDITLLKYLSNKTVHNLFDKKFKETKKNLKKNRDPGNLYSFLMADINLAHQARKQEMLTKKDVFRKEWFEPIDQLTKLFLKNILSYIEYLSNIKRAVNEKVHIPLIKEVTEFIETNAKYKEDIEVKIMYNQIKMLAEGKEECYLELKRLVKENPKKLTASQTSEILINLQNFCFQQMLIGKNVLEEEFEIANLNLNFNLNVKKRSIPIDLFSKLFFLGMTLEKYEWAKEFLSKHVKHLDEKFQNNALHFGNARLYFEYKEYEKALKELAKIKNYSFIHYKPAVKVLQMFILYELKLISLSEDSANSFRQFLRSDKLVTSDLKKQYNSFIKIYLQLIKIDFSNSKSKIKDLKFSISNQKGYLIARKWFNEKVEELEFKLVSRKNINAI